MAGTGACCRAHRSLRPTRYTLDCEEPVKNNRSRTVPLVAALRPVLTRARADKSGDELLFCSPEGGPLRLSNWRRRCEWYRVTRELGLAPVRIHDLRHTPRASG